MKNLFEEAEKCLLIADPQEKIAYSNELISDWQANKLQYREAENARIIDQPAKQDKPVIVPPRELPKRGFGSDRQLAALFHALAHIEITAVNLSWDSVCRFPGMPRDYYHDWIMTAADEGRHFLGLQKLIQNLGFDYGDFAVHGELWDMAVQTGHSLMHRMGIVHRVLEARALDVVPMAVKKLSTLNMPEASSILTAIANDEVSHVCAGSRWYRYACRQQQCDPDTTFFVLIKQYLKSYPRGPFNLAARKEAGFSDWELQQLQAYDLQQVKK